MEFVYVCVCDNHRTIIIANILSFNNHFVVHQKYLFTKDFVCLCENIQTLF